ncbi:MAG TPA: GNAT family N-acetyltransferase [Actinomycetales bacterium]|nr:GNAT family N-acetyltransferase [Actinomycetales bacterium]
MSSEPPSSNPKTSEPNLGQFGGIEMRQARREDIRAIVELIADDEISALREDLSDPLPAPYIDAFAAIEADPRTELLVAVQNEEVLATLQITYLPGLSRMGSERAQIEAVRVARAARGMGLGTHLLTEAIERAKARGCGLVQLTSDARRRDAQRFYKQLGFAETHVGMRLILEPQ